MGFNWRLRTSSLTVDTSLSVSGTDAGQFNIQSQPISPVLAGESTAFTVRFTPTSAGSKTASIAISNSDSDENPYDLTLSGTGEVAAIPEIVLKQSTTVITDGGSYNFGNKNSGTHADVSFTIENTGTANLTVDTPVSIGGVNGDQFSIQLQPVSPVLTGGSTTFTIRFSPTEAGSKSTTISIANNDSDENPYDLLLYGYAEEAAEPEMHLMQAATDLDDGSSSDFGDVPANGNNDVVFTIENFGLGDLNITIPLTISGVDTEQFSVQVQPPSVIPGNSNTTFTVRFAPTSTGEKEAAIAIENNDSDENPYTLILSGWGEEPLLPEMDLKVGADVWLADNDDPYGLVEEIDPGSHMDIIFTIYNDGPGSLDITTPLILIGSNVDQFSIQTQPSSSVPGSSNTTFTVRFSPTSEGDKTVSIAIANSDSDENPYDLTINAYGTANYPTYTVSTSASAHKGSFAPVSQPVVYGNTAIFGINALAGYKTVSVDGCGGIWASGNSYTTGVVTANCTVSATFVLLGDVNQNDSVDLSDVVQTLQIVSGIVPAVSVTTHIDVNNDGRIGLAEVLYALREVAGL